MKKETKLEKDNSEIGKTHLMEKKEEYLFLTLGRVLSSLEHIKDNTNKMIDKIEKKIDDLSEKIMDQNENVLELKSEIDKIKKEIEIVNKKMDLKLDKEEYIEHFEKYNKNRNKCRNDRGNEDISFKSTIITILNENSKLLNRIIGALIFLSGLLSLMKILGIKIIFPH